MSLTGPYTVISKLGEGGMAEVFKAVKSGPEGFEKPIALKRILPFYADHPTFIGMLAAEARLHARLDHPNLVQILDFFEMGGNHFIALEYVPGKNLKQIARDARARREPLPWEMSVQIAAEVLQGLDFAHKRNGPDGPLKIVHRDVSPQNILISYEGLVKLSDFGIARARMEREETSPGVLKGKERYAAPEQLETGDVDSRADLFSVAVVLCELLCERHPLEPGFTSSRNLRPEVPSTIHEAIERGMAKDPSGRFPDAAQFRRTLLSALSPASVSHGAEERKRWMERVYPKGREREDPPLERTPLLIEPSASLISGAARISWRGARRRIVPLSGRQWLLWLLAAAIVAFAILRVPHRSDPPPPPPADPTAMPTSPETKPTLGTIRVVGPSGARLFLNGRGVGRLPLGDLSVDPGTYVVLLKRAKGTRSMTRVKLGAGETRTVLWNETK
jgi:serine/threonine-protein kinase